MPDRLGLGVIPGTERCAHETQMQRREERGYPQASREDRMWPRTELLDLLGVSHPIIQAPMSGFTGPELVAAVSNAGALGSMGCGTLAANAIREQVERLRRATNRPFNLNFFVHPEPRIDAEAAQRVCDRLARYYDEFGLGAVPAPADLFPHFDEERLRLIVELEPRVVSFHFGLPPAEAVRRIKQKGTVVLSSATTVAEARRLEADGADAIIAQGCEAGGHRGTFTKNDGAGLIGAMALVPQIADAVRVPVIAAGGLADGRGIAAAFALGASGAQLGTAFLGCPEATVPPVHREALHQAADEDTLLTRVFSGGAARALRNRLTDEMGNAEALEFPVQVSLTLALFQAGSDAALKAFLPLWAGQAAPLVRDLPAARLVETLVAEAQSRLPRGPA
jgi:nitronate monooxygenase